MVFIGVLMAPWLIAAEFYAKKSNTNITNVVPYKSSTVNNLPKCLQYCNRNNTCDAVALTANKCNMFAILRDNVCLTNVTLVKKLGTSFYQKATRSVSQSCSHTNRCSSQLGLNCLSGKCSCNTTRCV